MKVALTGGTGFLGGQVLDRLISHRHEIRALTRKAQSPRENVKWIAGSLADEGALANLVEGADAVIHVAGVTNAPDLAVFDRGNRVGTLAMINAARAADIGRFVHISSLSAREPGLSNYGASKRAGEDAVIASGLDWRVLRPPGIYGPGELLDLFKMARTGFVAVPPKGSASWIHVDDAARLTVAMAESDAGQVLYEADDGRAGGWSHVDFGKALGAAVGHRVRIIAMPKSLLHIGARIDRLLRRDKAALTTDRVNYFVHPDWVIDPAKRPPPELWRPEIGTEAGLHATAGWYQANGWVA